MHLDHWDEPAADALPKSIPIFVQDEADALEVRKAGFTDLRILSDTADFKGVTLNRTSALHGVKAVTDAFDAAFLRVCGVVFSHPSHKTLYLAADTIWIDGVREAISVHAPGLLLLNCGNGQAAGLGRLIMNASDVLEVHQAAPTAMLVGTHMEAVNHCVLTRSAVRTYTDQQGFSDKLLLPADSETLTI